MSTIPTKASTTIPYICRIFIHLESVLAIAGTIELLTIPDFYISSLTREPLPGGLDTALQLMTTQLAGAWLLIFFIELVVLRVMDDLRIWRLMCTGILVFDVVYFYSLPQALGGFSKWAVLEDWTWQEWFTAVLSFPFTANRLAIALGVGLKEEKTHRA